MYPITSFIKRHALVTFFALAYALSWSISLFEAHSILPFGPLLRCLLYPPRPTKPYQPVRSATPPS